jgi:hypothetical protein
VVPVSTTTKPIIVRKKLDWANSCDCNLLNSENITQTIQPVSWFKVHGGSVGHVVGNKPEIQWSIKEYEMRRNRYIEHYLHTLTLSSQIEEHTVNLTLSKMKRVATRFTVSTSTASMLCK